MLKQAAVALRIGNMASYLEALKLYDAGGGPGPRCMLPTSHTGPENPRALPPPQAPQAPP